MLLGSFGFIKQHHDALGERAWTRLSALINRVAVPLKYSLAEAPKSFTSTDLIAIRQQDMECSNAILEQNPQTNVTG